MGIGEFERILVPTLIVKLVNGVNVMQRKMSQLSMAFIMVMCSTALGADQSTSKIVTDIPYVESGDSERQRLDLYLPDGKKEVPVIVFFHGGGYTKGDRKDVENFGKTFANQGIAVVAVGYRLLPSNKYPAPVEDGAKALAWIKTNAAKYGLATDKLFVGGHSAGAHLASVLAVDARYASDIRGVISLSGNYKIAPERAESFGGEQAAKQASPITHVRPGLPAFFLAYADHDSPNKDKQTAEFADALKSNKVPVTVFEAKDRNHSTLFTKIVVDDPNAESIRSFVIERIAVNK